MNKDLLHHDTHPLSDLETRERLIKVYEAALWFRQQAASPQTYWEGCYTEHTGCLARYIQDLIEEADDGDE